MCAAKKILVRTAFQRADIERALFFNPVKIQLHVLFQAEPRPKISYNIPGHRREQERQSQQNRGLQKRASGVKSLFDSDNSVDNGREARKLQIHDGALKHVEQNKRKE